MTKRKPAPLSRSNGAVPRPGALRSVCVYCGSGRGKNPAYAAAARTLGKSLAKAGVDLVYGGGSLGLMGEVATSTLKHGGRVVGIIPAFLSNRERMLDAVNELVVTEDMHQRKMEMFKRSDAFVALPNVVGISCASYIAWRAHDSHRRYASLTSAEATPQRG